MADTALLVVDMQDYFLQPGMQDETPAARAIVPNINRLADAVRAADGAVFWIRMFAGPTARPWPALDELRAPEHNARRHRELAPDGPGFPLSADLDVRDADRIVDKDRFSALAAGASELPALLAEAGVTTVLITGTATDVCCATTARDAVQLGYRIVFVADATATDDEARHAATLEDIGRYFGVVRTTEEVVEALLA